MSGLRLPRGLSTRAAGFWADQPRLTAKARIAVQQPDVVEDALGRFALLSLADNEVLDQLDRDPLEPQLPEGG